MHSSWALALLPLTSALYQNGSVIAPCDSPLYCQGEILREIELARPFEDSKLYVDLYVQLSTAHTSALANHHTQSNETTH